MDKLSDLLAMAWLFYILNIAAVIILVFQRPTDLLSWTLFFGTIYFQSVTLPVINNTAKRSGEKMMKVLQETHDTAMESHSELHSKLDLLIENMEVKHGRDSD
jgi:Zn-dependent membrane protease YugP